MSEGEVKQAEASRKGPIVMAAAGVIGFCAGWGISVMVNPEARTYLSMVGLVVGATVGWLIGRLVTKPSA